MKDYFNIKQSQTEGHRGILPPADNNTPWLTNQEPPTTPPSTSSPVAQNPNDKPCPKCNKPMYFGEGDWYCENCNELFPGDPNKCPKCGVGEMSDWEEGENDAWDWSTESHYTKPSGYEHRICDNCGYEEEQERNDPRNDPDYQYDLMRDMEDDRNATGDNISGDHTASYSGAKKTAAGEYPSTGEGHKCMKCGKPTVTGWGPTMCPGCSKKEDKKAKSYFNLTKIAQSMSSRNETCPQCGEGILSPWEPKHGVSDLGVITTTNKEERECYYCGFYEERPYQHNDELEGNPWAGADFLGKDSDIPDSDLGGDMGSMDY